MYSMVSPIAAGLNGDRSASDSIVCPPIKLNFCNVFFSVRAATLQSVWHVLVHSAHARPNVQLQNEKGGRREAEGSKSRIGAPQSKTCKFVHEFLLKIIKMNENGVKMHLLAFDHFVLCSFYFA